MAVRKIRGWWTVDFMFNFERLRRRSPQNSKGAAEAFEAHLRREVAVHGSVPAMLKALRPTLAPACPTLAAFVPRWFEGYVIGNNRPKEQKQKTSTFRAHLLPAFGSLRLDAITLERIERYKGQKKLGGLTAKTINNHLAALHRCLATAKEWGVLAELPPMKPMKLGRPSYRFLSEDEEATLLAAAPADQLRSLILVALRTGLRFSELTALRWEDLDLVRGQVTVQRSMVEGNVGPTKNGRTRHVGLTRDALAELRGIPRTQELVFHHGGSPLHQRVMIVRIRRLCARAGIERATWHDFRHTFASRLVSRGAPLLAVQRLLGHADIAMTMRYAHLAPDQLGQAIALLEDDRVAGSGSRLSPVVGSPAFRSAAPSWSDPGIASQYSKSTAFEAVLSGGGSEGIRTGSEDVENSAKTSEKTLD